LDSPADRWVGGVGAPGRARPLARAEPDGHWLRMKSYLVITNPSSGRGGGLRRTEALRTHLSEEGRVEVVETTHRGHATELAANHADQVDRVIAVGGDGTLNEVLCGLMSTGREADHLPELGFLPSGTANAAVRAFGFGSDPAEVSKRLVDARASPVDVGMVEYDGRERAFLLWFGAGYDAVVIRALNEKRTGLMGVSGLLGAAPNVVSALARYDAPLIEAEVDGSPLDDCSTVVISNVQEIAFRGVLAEGADPGDGALDVVGVPRAHLLRLLALGLRMFTSSLSSAEAVEHRLAQRVTLRSDGQVPFQLDGEPVGTLPAVVRVRRGAIRLLRT